MFESLSTVLYENIIIIIIIIIIIYFHFLVNYSLL